MARWTKSAIIFLVLCLASTAHAEVRVEAGQLIAADDSRTWAAAVLPALHGQAPELAVEALDDGWTRVSLRWEVSEETPQDELAVPWKLASTPDFFWTPHLAPEPGDCIGQHVFRSPAMIAAWERTTLVVVPDLDWCGKDPGTPWFMDVDAPEGVLTLGLSATQVSGHVQFKKTGGMRFAPGEHVLAFYCALYRDEAEPPNPWARVSSLLWARWGHPLFEQGAPGTAPMERYVEHTYRWAFEQWAGAVWQEFEIGGKRAGAPAFIVNVTQSPNFPGQENLREFLSIWNQAWFSSLRSASGLYRHARRQGGSALLEKARLTKELALAAPQREGIFPTVYRTRMEEVKAGGETLNKSLGWETGYWTNSNRVPWNMGVTDQWYHVLDDSWTCLLMLRWYEELEQDPRLLEYATRYAEKLLSLQDSEGFFPAWLHPETLAPAEALRQSPETSMSVTFLLKLEELTGKQRYREAALRAMHAVLAGPAREGRWEDFETYWSCNGFGQKDQVGRKVARNGMYKQCNFSMFWTAEALLECYRKTGDSAFLAWGRRTLDELSMTQQVWQPPFIYVPALGGFGVMNFDGEWNDARQSLFAELFLRYYEHTGDAALFERGIAALRASFVMMYCPENPQAKTLWEKKWPFFGPADYGFAMENYGHGGVATEAGDGIGEFTIYDWGNGAAAEAFNRIRDHFGDVYVDPQRGRAFGLNAVRAAWHDGALQVEPEASPGRKLVVVMGNGQNSARKSDAPEPQ